MSNGDIYDAKERSFKEMVVNGALTTIRPREPEHDGNLVNPASRDHSRQPARPAAADPRRARLLSELQAITAERSRLDERMGAAIDRARDFGLTWAQIATALGMRHRQGAEQLRRRLRNDPDRAHRAILQDSPSGTAQPANRAKTPEQTAARAVDEARSARSQLVGLDPAKPRTGLLRDLDSAALAMRRCLADLQNRADRADQRNKDKDGNERPAWQHHLPTGWEDDAIGCADKLKSIADHISDLARTHAQAVVGHSAARQHVQVAQAETQPPTTVPLAEARTDENRQNNRNDLVQRSRRWRGDTA